MKPAVIIASSIALLVSCSTVKLEPGEYALQKSKVVVENGELPASSILPYVRAADKYNSETVEASVRNIDNHLRFLGYYNSSIEPSVKFGKDKARVTYLVNPKGRLTVDSVFFNVPSDSAFLADFLADTAGISVRKGDFLSESSLSAESDRSASYLRNKGYYDINRNSYSFVADSLSGNGKVSLEYRINSPATPVKYHIGQVRISYPQDLKFNDRVLKELNSIHPGDGYSDDAVNVAYNRFSALRIFNTVNVNMSPSTRDSSEVDCNVTLTPGELQGFRFNLEASINSTGLFGISPQISYFNKNIFRGGEWLDVAFNGNFQRRFKDPVTSNEFGINASLSLPRFLGLRYSVFKDGNIPRTEFKASFNYQSRPEYSRRITSFSYGYNGIFNRGGSYLNYKFYPIKISTVKMGSMSEEFAEQIWRNPMFMYTYTSHVDVGMGGNLYLSDSPILNPKETYSYLKASVAVSGNILSLFNGLMPLDDMGQHAVFGVPYAQYAKAEIQLGKTWRLGVDQKSAFATRLVIGVGKAYGNSTKMPYEEQFFCGGANSMRAWQARSLGPGKSIYYGIFAIPSQTGDMKIELDAEYRFPLFWKLYGAVFAEAGNVWLIYPENRPDATIEDFGYFTFKNFYKEVGVDWGLGLRLDIDLIVLRLDAGFRIYDPQRPERWLKPSQWFKTDGYGIQFGVGYPF